MVVEHSDNHSIVTVVVTKSTSNSHFLLPNVFGESLTAGVICALFALNRL